MPATTEIRWGVLGPGRIAERFCSDLARVKGCRLHAVASRTASRAAAFALNHHAVHGYDSYEALLADPDVDVVYIATPHTLHAEQIRLSLAAGKAVLCEKPVTTSAADFAGCSALARERGLFLMEGMWSRLGPVWSKMADWIESGRIGEPRLCSATFCFQARSEAGGRLFTPSLGGGALWDVGIYTIAFATTVFGVDVREQRSLTRRGETGVDEQAVLLLSFGEGGLAHLGCGIRHAARNEAWVAGTEGRIEIPETFWRAREIRLLDPGGGVRDRLELPCVPGFDEMIAHVRDCLHAGLTESPVLPHSHSLLWQRILDKALAENP